MLHILKFSRLSVVQTNEDDRATKVTQLPGNYFFKIKVGGGLESDNSFHLLEMFFFPHELVPYDSSECDGGSRYCFIFDTKQNIYMIVYIFIQI